MGIDLGSAAGGIAILTSGGQLGRVLAFRRIGRMDLSEWNDLVERLIERFEIEVIATERPFFGGKYPGAGLSQRERQGIVRRLCQARGIRMVQYTPSEWKKGFTGSGKATKEQVRRAVLARLGFDAPDEHTADSAAIGCVALSRDRRSG
jgi:Holliday junction resolvasome RuvABC endonuclease subunit